MPKKILSSVLITGYVKDIHTTNSNLAEPLYLKIEIQPGVLKVLNIREDFVRFTDHKKRGQDLFRHYSGNVGNCR
jgi:hypothetical protein